MVCTATVDHSPEKQVSLEITHPTRRFQRVAIDFQTITDRNIARNMKVLAMISVFTRFARAVAIPEEKAEVVATALISENISVFGPVEAPQFDEINLVGSVVKSLSDE